MLIAISSLAAVAAAPEYTFDIPAQPAGLALGSLAKQTKTPLLFLYDDVQTITANPLVGTYSLEHAVEILLDGTGLEARFNQQGVLTVRQLDRSFWQRLTASITKVFSPSAKRQAEPASFPRTIEEIIVTAQKQEQSLYEVGLSVSIVSGEAIQARGIDSLDELFNDIPNMQLWDPSGGGIPLINIRGVGTDSARANNSPAAAIYIDDVYQPSPAHGAFAFFDLERIEVLKGPQGGLYGRNTTAGAVRLMTKRPQLGETEANLTLGYGRFDRRELSGGLSAPLSDNSALRVAFHQVRSDDTFYHSVSENKDHGAEKHWAARARWLWQPSNSWTIDWAVFSGDDESETPLLKSAGAFDATTFAGPSPTPFTLGEFQLAPCSLGISDTGCVDILGSTPASQGVEGRFDSQSRTFPQLDNHIWGSTLHLALDLSDAYTFTSITAHSSFDHNRNIDFTGLAGGLQDIHYQTDIQAFSQEFRLSYFGGGNLSWIVGVNYANDRLKDDSLARTVGVLLAEQDYTQKTEAWSLFSHWEYALSKHWIFILEERWTEEKKQFVGGTVSGFFSPSFADDTETWGNWSGKISLEWHRTDNLLVYGSVSRGYKSGGYNGAFTFLDQQLEPYDEEIVLAYELGVKSVLADNLRISAAAFYYDYRDQQSESINPIDAITFSLGNVGDVEVSGAEMDITWLPTQSLNWQLSAGYTDAHIVDSSVSQSTVFGNQVPIKGQNIRRYSNWSINSVLGYHIDLPYAFSLIPEVEYTYRSAHDLSFGLSPAVRRIAQEGGYDLTDIRLILRDTQRDWQFKAWVKNAENKKYRILANRADLGGFSEIFGSGITYGVTLNLAW